MISCKCVKCGEQTAYEDQKSAWLAGWDFVGPRSFCGECSVMPTNSKDPVDEIEEILICNGGA